MSKFFSLAALAALALAPAATAQTRFAVGGGFDVDRDAAFIGAGARIPMATTPLTFAPHVDVYLTEGNTALQANLDGLYYFNGVSASPYIGAGLGVGYQERENSDDNVNLGLNLLVGAEFRAPLRPYLQARVTVSGFSGLSIGGGVQF